MSRGSDVMTRKRKSSVVISQSGELKFEEAEESNEAEVKEVIIYLPPSQDDFDSEVARSGNHCRNFPTLVLDRWSAGTRNLSEDMPLIVPINMSHFYGLSSSTCIYSCQGSTCRVGARMHIKRPFARTLIEVGPRRAIPAESLSAKSPDGNEDIFYTVNLLDSDCAEIEDGAKGVVSYEPLISDNLKTRFYHSSDTCEPEFQSRNNSNINPSGYKINNDKSIVKLKTSGVENFNATLNGNSTSRADIKVTVEDIFGKHLRVLLRKNEKAARCNVNKKSAFGVLVLFSFALLGYYNFVWFR